MKTLFTFLLSLTIVAVFAEGRQQNTKPFPPASLNPTISITGLGSGITPNDLVANLIGPGIAYSNVQFTGMQGGTATASAGLFTQGQTIFGIDEGTILCSGRIANSLGPNGGTDVGTNNLLPGDADLAAVFPGLPLFDACVLEFDFVPTGNQLYVQYVFGSDEYNEWVNTNFIDCFAFFLDGVNIAFVPGTSTPVSINSVNLAVNSASYKNNQLGVGDFGHIPGPYDIECDGFTIPFTASAALTPNVSHHIKLVIADKADGNLDSWVFLHGGTFGNVNPSIPTLSEWGLIFLGLTLLAFGTFYIMKLKG